MPSTSVPSVPSVPKRASAAAVVKSFVFEARIRGVRWRQRNTREACPSLDVHHIGAGIGAGGAHVAGQALDHGRPSSCAAAVAGSSGEQGI